MKNDLKQWVGLLGAPVCWLCSFEARFALASAACLIQSKWPLYSLSLAAASLCAAFAALSWRQRNALASEGDAGAVSRGRFMALAGTVVSIGFLLVVLAQAVPETILEACE